MNRPKNRRRRPRRDNDINAGLWIRIGLFLADLFDIDLGNDSE